jgi:hypothetical protein
VKLLALGVVALALCGCESTQSKSARLERAAKTSLHEKGLVIKQPSRDVTVAATTVLHDENGTAAVVELRNRSSRGLVGVPVAFSVRDAAQKKLYANDVPGLDASLVSAGSIAPRATLEWINDQVTLDGDPRAVVAQAGAEKRQAPSALPQIEVGSVALEDDGSVGGRVTNRSNVEQRRLVVYVVGRRDDQVVTAGRAIVQVLKPGASAKFTAFPIGDPTGARFEASAPPTVVAP